MRGRLPRAWAPRTERKFGAVESQVPWCGYTPDRTSAILRETSSLGVNAKSLVTLVFRHTGDDTTLLKQASPRAWAPSALTTLVFRHTGDDTALLQ